jgi:tRNA-guanine family transglycosylase
MGLGYPLDLVVCTALGVDMYDCVYPTRTARFGVALVSGKAPGTLKLKSHECAVDTAVIDADCACEACTRGVSRARLHALLKSNQNHNVLAIQLLTQHNLAYMMKLVNDMRASIMDQSFPQFVKRFVNAQFDQTEDIPSWVRDALDAAGISLA